MTYTNLTLGELLSSENPAIRRNATGILKQLQKSDELLSYWQKELEDRRKCDYCNKQFPTIREKIKHQNKCIA